MYLPKYCEMLEEFCSLILDCLQVTLKLLAKIISFCIQIIFNALSKILIITKQYNNKIFAIIKLFCFVILVLSGLSVTLDYLSYPYIYKLIVSDNKYGFDLPAISVCTERHVFFDKHKVIQYFDSQQKYEEFKKINEDLLHNNWRDCLVKFENLSINGNMRMQYLRKRYKCQTLDIEYNYNMSLFFRDYEKKIFESLSFDQMKNLTISANELFKCSAKLHFRYESKHSNATIIENCFERFDVLESIYGNDFGICYTFFSKNYSIYLKDDDYIQFDIKYETQNKFMINGFFDTNLPSEETENDNEEFEKALELFSDDYFEFYLFVNKFKTRLEKNSKNVFKSTRNSLNSELRFRKTSVELLSTPYMQECKQYGKSTFLNLFRFNKVFFVRKFDRI